MVSDYRLRDAVHGLITLRGNEADQLALQCINAPEFQRLRRIKQLGFSDLVFDGATHSRFAHCVGVFHTARQILEVIRRLESSYDEQRALESTVGALLHDLGHGPFSHTFEQVQKRVNPSRKKHEVWTGEIIEGEGSSFRKILGDDLCRNVSEMLRRSNPSDIYDSVVSSQFDADRIDYLLRDKYMSGVQFASVDLDWLLDNLRVGEIPISAPEDDSDVTEVPGFYLHSKGMRAAESYLLARHHLYEQVYLHKTTRSAEQMLEELLYRFSQLVRDGRLADLNLPISHPLVQFFSSDSPSLSQYLNLDDTMVWSALFSLKSSSEATIADLSRRLLDRDLYKCFDVGYLADHHHDEAALPRFRSKLKELNATLSHHPFLVDNVTLTPYKVKGFGESGAFQKVLIDVGREGKRSLKDIANESPVFKSLESIKFVRVYGPSNEALEEVKELWKTTIQ